MENHHLTPSNWQLSNMIRARDEVLPLIQAALFNLVLVFRPDKICVILSDFI